MASWRHIWPKIAKNNAKLGQNGAKGAPKGGPRGHEYAKVSNRRVILLQVALFNEQHIA